MSSELQYSLKEAHVNTCALFFRVFFTNANVDTTSNIRSTCVVLALVAGRQDCHPHPDSQQRTLLLLSQHCDSSFSVSDFTLRDCKYSLRDACQCIAQPNTILLDCILYLVQYQFILGKVYMFPIHQGNANVGGKTHIATWVQKCLPCKRNCVTLAHQTDSQWDMQQVILPSDRFV